MRRTGEAGTGGVRLSSEHTSNILRTYLEHTPNILKGGSGMGRGMTTGKRI
jgi:hypothetical protein